MTHRAAPRTTATSSPPTRVLATGFVALGVGETRPPWCEYCYDLKKMTATGQFREALRAYAWPGNVRELRNALERAVALAEGTTIEPFDLPPDVLLANEARPDGDFHHAVEEFRKQVIRDALGRAGGSQTQAAKELGLQRTYLARLIRKYSLR